MPIIRVEVGVEGTRLGYQSLYPALKYKACALRFRVRFGYRYTSAGFGAAANGFASHSADASQIVREQSAIKPRTDHSETLLMPCGINQTSHYMNPLMSGRSVNTG